MYSRTLRRYHKFLWNKALPSGRLFDLNDTVRGAYLHHSSELGKFFLTSDSVIATFTKQVRMRHIANLFTMKRSGRSATRSAA